MVAIGVLAGLELDVPVDVMAMDEECTGLTLDVKLAMEPTYAYVTAVVMELVMTLVVLSITSELLAIRTAVLTAATVLLIVFITVLAVVLDISDTIKKLLDVVATVLPVVAAVFELEHSLVVLAMKLLSGITKVTTTNLIYSK